MTKEMRPGGTAVTSFPSGHSAEVFASAELLRREYKDISPWYGVADYTMAAATGYLRMYNNKHWLSDVCAGAGIGILSTDVAYWLYPKIFKTNNYEHSKKSIVVPTYSNHTFGVAWQKNI